MGDFNMVEWLEDKEKQIVERIEDLAVNGKPEDAVKLKANATLWGRIRPERTKMEVDVANKSPYELLMRKINGENKEGLGDSKDEGES